MAQSQQLSQNVASQINISNLPDSELAELTAPSVYDNEVTIEYKQATRLRVPRRYLLTKLGTDLTHDQDFETIFQRIRQLANQGANIGQIWDVLVRDSGIDVLPTNFIFVWLNAFASAFNVSSRAELTQVEQYALTQIQNYLRYIKESDKYQTFDQVRADYGVWLSAFNNELTFDFKKTLGYIAAQAELAAIPNSVYTPLELKTVTIEYDYATEPGVNPLLDWFNATKTSYTVPFIQYNLSGTVLDSNMPRYYKIYRGTSIDLQPKYENSVIQTHSANEPNTMYMNVYLGENLENQEDTDSEARNGKKINFGIAKFEYLPLENLVRVSVTAPRIEGSLSEGDIIARIHAHLPGLPIPLPQNVRQKKITGTFTLPEKNLYEIPLLELVMNNPLFSTYLYMDETGKTYAEKNVFSLHYRGLDADFGGGASSKTVNEMRSGRSMVTASFIESVIQKGDILKYVEGGVALTGMAAAAMPVVQVHISMASSLEIANKFIDIVTKLFTKYFETYKQLDLGYIAYIPEYAKMLEDGSLKPTKKKPSSRGKNRSSSAARSVGEAGAEDDEVVEEEIAAVGANASIAEGRRISFLKRYAPDLFISGYARLCQANQPIPVPAGEEEAWRSRYVDGKPRYILKFPKDNPKYMFVCPDDAKPHVGLKKNKHLSNKTEFPYLPCCYKTDQTASPETGLTRYLTGTDQDKLSAQNINYIFSSDKIMDPYRRGRIDSHLQDYLRKYDLNAGEFQRFGVVDHDENSFLHCVLLALNVEEYDQAPDKVDFVNTVRENLFAINTGSGVLRPEIVRQELYDMSNESIVRDATNNKIFFDPLKFYRLLEELFEINIYVFALRPKNFKTGREESLLQLPRHKVFHSHIPNPGRRVVLILRHWGSVDADLEFPQCELLIEARKGYPLTFFDDPVEYANPAPGNAGAKQPGSMDTLLYQTMSYISSTLTWSISPAPSDNFLINPPSPTINLLNPVPNILASPNLSTPVVDFAIANKIAVAGEKSDWDVACRRNVYNVFNYARLFGRIPIVAQVIDGAGKARVLALASKVNPSSGMYSDERVYVNILPSYTMNIPEFDLVQVIGKEPSHELCIELFGTPSSYITTLDGQSIVGFYFPAGDIPDAFFCQCKKVPVALFPSVTGVTRSSPTDAAPLMIPESAATPFTPIQRLRKLKKAAGFITQIIKYCFLIDGQPANINAFIQNILTDILPQNVQTRDSVTIYNISGLPRILPSGVSSTDVLNKLSQYAPSFISGGKIFVYDTQMLLGIQYMLVKYREANQNLSVPASGLRELTGYYQEASDFNYLPDSEYMLLTLAEFNNWSSKNVELTDIQSKYLQNLKDEIQEKLDKNAFVYQEPYIYKEVVTNVFGVGFNNENETYYLIQNVLAGSLSRAINVATNWVYYKTNLGYHSEEYMPSAADEGPGGGAALLYPAHKIYRISSGGNLSIEQDNSGGNTNYIKILNYNPTGLTNYAAMLQIL